MNATRAHLDAPATTDTMVVERDGAWLIARLGRMHRVVSWAIHGGGLGRAATVAWLRVTDDELRPPVDARELLRTRLAGAALPHPVGLLTSADLDRFADETAQWGELEARAVVTAGLGNALRAGDPPGPAGRIGPRVGTINVLCRVSAPLTDEGLLEAMAIAVEARTAAVLAAGIPSRRTGRPATGTGTDCVVIAAPEADPRVAYAGKHTAIGHIVGAAVEAATAAAVARWQEARP